jgi:hypothetical protein
MVEAPQIPQPQPETQKKNTGMAIVAYIFVFCPSFDRIEKRPVC